MPAISPRTQQLQAGMNAGPDQETALFEQGMSEMAYNLLTSRMPDVMQDVVTFKVLDSDLDKGSGVGAFVVLRQNTPLYIPVVMVDNAIKPLEIFFHKALNVFLPLTKGWLDEIDKNTLASLGQGVKTPETLYTDVDIRNVVVPPITGRFSYAAWIPLALVDVARVIDVQTLEKTAIETAFMLPSLLAAAPNRLKIAYTTLLEKNPRLMKQAAATYGVSTLTTALQPRLEKVAAKQQHGGALWIADADSTPTDFSRIFGDKAGEAYTGVRKKGFAAKDDRVNRNMAVQEQPFAHWCEPKQPGVYTLYASDGAERTAFVMPFPIDVFDKGTRYGRRPAIPGHNPLIDDSYRDNIGYKRSVKVYPQGRPDEGDYATRRRCDAAPFLAVFGNGDYIEPDKLVGRDNIADALAGALHKRLFTDVSGAPKTGKGFFVRQMGTTFQATVPLEIKSITNGADGVRRICATSGSYGPEKTIATDPTHPYNTIWMPQGADVVYLPPDFIWVPLKTKLNEKSWFQSAFDLQESVSHALSAVGAKKVSIKDAGAKQFSINGMAPMGFVPALKKLAHGCGISVDVAEVLLEKAAAARVAVAWIATGPQLAYVQQGLDKRAAANDAKSKKKASPGDDGGDGSAAPEGDPSQGGAPLGQEAAMSAMGQAPPPPAPLDLAAMEMDQHIQQEMQKLVEKQQTIQMLLQRSSEIAGGAPPAPSVQTQAMGAPPSSMNLATGAPGMQPGMSSILAPGQGQPAQDPSMGAGAPQGMDPSQGMDPNMDPSQDMDPNMDPNMGAGGPPGTDPSMSPQQPQQEPPHAMMPPDGPNAQTLPQEVNPHFLDQAAQLHSADMFDAAAVATLAQAPALHGVVGQYLPNLEKAVDNLGRVLLTLWMQEVDLKPQVGEQTFSGLEDNLQTVFKGLGSLVLRLSRGIQAVKEPDNHAA